MIIYCYVYLGVKSASEAKILVSSYSLHQQSREVGEECLQTKADNKLDQERSGGKNVDLKI